MLAHERLERQPPFRPSSVGFEDQKQSPEGSSTAFGPSKPRSAVMDPAPRLRLVRIFAPFGKGATFLAQLAVALLERRIQSGALALVLLSLSCERASAEAFDVRTGHRRATSIFPGPGECPILFGSCPRTRTRGWRVRDHR